MQFKFKRVRDNGQLSTIKRFLYDELFKKGKWKVCTHNPTGIKATEHVLTDNFDAVSDWFTVYGGDDLIGCVRTHGPLNCKHELEYYRNIPSFLKGNESRQISRLTIKKDYRHISVVIPELIRTFVNHAYMNGVEYLFTTSTFPLPGKLYLKFHLNLHEQQGYIFPGSHEKVYLLVADRDDMKVSIQHCTNLIERYRRKRYDIQI